MSKSNSSDNSNESKPKIDITTEGWNKTKGNDFIYYSNEETKWYCVQCDIIFDTPGDVGSHKKQVHQVVTVEESETPEIEDSDGDGQNGGVDRTKSSKFRKELFGESIKYDRGIHDTGDLALQINIEEESKLVSQLIKNPYVTFLFAKLKDERKIYPDWSLADFLREGALYLCKKLGCEITFEFDIELLKQDKEFSQIALKINEAWEEYDAEMGLEKSVEKEKS